MHLQFPFGEPLEDVLRTHFHRDADKATLSAKFRLYYLLRPLIPTLLRRWLQKSRNQTLRASTDWFIPTAFLADLQRAVEQVPSQTTIHPWPDGKQHAVCLTHDVETADGLQRVLEVAAIEERLGLRSAWFFVPYKYCLDPGVLRELQDRGHEVGIHGYNHDGRLFVARSLFQRRALRINEAGKRYRANGFRAPMVHRNLDWMQALDFQYDCSCFDTDPFQAMPGGIGSLWPLIVGKLVELPYTLPQDHTLMVTLDQEAYTVWIRKLDLIRRLSAMAMLITHPDYLDSPQRLDIYQRFCQHICEAPDPWLALPGEIATWWRARQNSKVDTEGVIQGPTAERGRVVTYDSLFDWT